MSETLKFGNGLWATKVGSTLAYNDENGNFKPLPFSFDRASSATRVNKDGLIETVGSGEPRIDFKDNTKGSLLLEPSRSNLLPYSGNFSTWAEVFAGGTISDIISPNGTDYGIKITDNNVNNTHRIQLGVTTASSGSFTYSLFLKKGTLTTAYFQVFSGTTASNANVDLENGTITSGGLGINHTIEDYGNDWYRCSISGTLASTSTTVYLYTKQSGSYVGNGDYLYAWGAQLEQGSYATSYIPTSGQANGVTRVADVCSQTPPSGVIGQTEGTIYFESTINGLQGGDMRFQLSDGSTNNWFFLSSGEATGIGVKARAYINNGNVNQFNSYSEYLSEGTHKYALSYKLNDIAFYVDGVQVALDSSATIPSCDEITLSGSTPTSPNTSHFLSYNEVKLYNTRLSNSELQALTSI